MKIILEGCEGVGKTTLATKLIGKYKLDYVHITNKDPNDYSFYKETMRKEDVIYDRHLLGEMIYPDVYNRKGNLNEEQLIDLLEFAKKEKVHIFVLTTDLEELEERVRKRNKFKPSFILDKLEVIHDKFFDLAMKYHINLIDTSKNTFKQITEIIEHEYDE